MTESLANITSLDLGPLGIYHLRRLWARSRLIVQGIPSEELPEEWLLDNLLYDGLGLGLEATIQFLYQAATEYALFEQWILERNDGAVTPQTRDRINQAILSIIQTNTHPPIPETLQHHSDAVLNETDLQFFAKNGYVILPNAVTPEESKAAEQAVWDHLGMDPEVPDSWYLPKVNMQRIMVQLFQHPALEANRRSPRIHRAFAQLWETEQLWYTTDRVSFNPPERHTYTFPGPGLHWDAHFEIPFSFGLQGLLYLTDTAAEQGAFTCVPGFQHHIDKWLASLPEGADPQAQELETLGAIPIPGKAGDLIIWHHALPHGSRPNRATVPRLVQYIKMYPVGHRNI